MFGSTTTCTSLCSCIFIILATSHTQAFTFTSTNSLLSINTASSYETRLNAKSRKSSLLELQDDSMTPKKKPRKMYVERTESGSVRKLTNKERQKQRKGVDRGGDAVVSSDLAQWAAAASDGSTDEVAATTVTGTRTSTSETKEIKRNKSTAAKEDKRIQKLQRRAEDEAMVKRAKEAITELEDLFQEKQRDMSGILARLRMLCTDFGTNSSSNNIRSITSRQEFLDYKMVWAGSDAAVCHVGTGLHKVPLARLQEVFLSIGKKRVEINEVIRILGPFPNVKNMLQGNVKVSVGGGESVLTFTYSSMIDGTGKELSAAGSEQRKVDLKVLYAADQAIVCTTSIDDDGAVDYFESDNGASLLVFFREKDLDGELDALRA